MPPTAYNLGRLLARAARRSGRAPGWHGRPHSQCRGNRPLFSRGQGTRTRYRGHRRPTSGGGGGATRRDDLGARHVPSPATQPAFRVGPPARKKSAISQPWRSSRTRRAMGAHFSRSFSVGHVGKANIRGRHDRSGPAGDRLWPRGTRHDEAATHFFYWEGRSIRVAGRRGFKTAVRAACIDRRGPRHSTDVALIADLMGVGVKRSSRCRSARERMGRDVERD